MLGIISDTIDLDEQLGHGSQEIFEELIEKCNELACEYGAVQVLNVLLVIYLNKSAQYFPDALRAGVPFWAATVEEAIAAQAEPDAGMLRQ